MNLLNRYFTPFAALLILMAVKFRWEDETARLPIQASIAIWVVSALVNWWFTANTYRFVRWARHLKTLQVWLNYVWAVPLFYLLGDFWGPIWLLFVMAPVTAALYQGFWQTVAATLVSAGTMLAILWLRVRAVGSETSLEFWGQPFSHAAFIVVFSLFIHSLAQTALRLRDISVGRPTPP